MTLQYYICYCIKQKITGLKKSYLFLYTGWLPPPGPSCRRIAGRPPSLPVLRLAAAPGTTVQEDGWQAALLTCPQAGCRPRDHRAGGWLAGHPPCLYSGWLPPPGPPDRRRACRPPQAPIPATNTGISIVMDKNSLSIQG